MGTEKLTPLSDFEKFLQLWNAMKHFSNIFFRYLSLCSIIFIDICVVVLRYYTIFFKCLINRKWHLFLPETSELGSFQTPLLL